MVSAPAVQTGHGHEVNLAGAWPLRADGAPSILQRTDENFLPAFLAELASPDASALVSAHRPPAGPEGVLRLFQPVHQAFNLALVEAHCLTFGQPRLDARQIESAGLVVRRVRTTDTGARFHEAWCATRHRISGWTPLPPVADPEHARDPDPARRRAPRLTADPAFDRATFGGIDSTAEETSSLFVAPPDTAAATGRTLLYGLIPVTSASRAGPLSQGPEPDAAEWNKHLSPLLRTSAARPLWPRGRATLDRSDLAAPVVLDADESIHTNRTRFVLLVRQLAQEFSLLRPASLATRDALLARLNTRHVVLVDDSTYPIGNYLLAAARLYFEKPEPSPSSLTVLRPQTWPEISAAFAAEVATTLRQLARETIAGTFAAQSAGGRFDDPHARYVVRAFIRVRQPHDCPPRIVWSPCSEEFQIAPWYEPGPKGPVPVALPDPFDPAFLNRARPGVAFNVPARLANLLNQDPKNFFNGNAGPGSGFSLDWICGFSIPIITVCAFIVLNVMLNLLNFVFRWLPFVKICVPLPRPK